MPAGLVATDDSRFNTGTRPASIRAAESRPPSSYSQTTQEGLV
jgi:hypothetical protein